MNEEVQIDFIEYMTQKYGAKGRRSIRFSDRFDELHILLGIKDAKDLDGEDKKYLNDEQLKLILKSDNTNKDTYVSEKMTCPKQNDTDIQCGPCIEMIMGEFYVCKCLKINT